MPDNNDLVNMLRVVIQEEIKPVHQEIQELRQDVQEVRQDVQELRQGQHESNKRLTALEAGQQELKKGQAAIEATVNDLRAINRGTHKKIFTQLDAIWDDVKRIENRLDVQEKKAIQ